MKPASSVAALLIALIGIAHVWRLVTHTEVTVGGRVVPMAVSVLGSIVAAVLSVLLFREARART